MPTLREDIINSGIKDRVYMDKVYGPYLTKDFISDRGKLKLQIIYPPSSRTSPTRYVITLIEHLDDPRAPPSFAGALKRRKDFEL